MGHGGRVSRVGEGGSRPQNRGKAVLHGNQGAGDKVVWGPGALGTGEDRSKDTVN